MRQSLRAGLWSGVWLLTLVGVLAWPAAARAAEPEERLWFRAMDLPQPTQTTVDAIAARAVLRAFMEEHPHIQVERFSMPSVQGTSMDTGPLMAIAAGMPPHAMYVNFRQSSTYINHGFLDPLEILLARKLSDNPAVRQTDEQGRWLADPTEAEVAHALALIRERVPDPAWPVMYREADNPDVVRGEHVWALPTETLVMGLLYRKDLFHAAGLDPERPPQTWEELLEYARKLTVPEKRQYGIMMTGGSVISWGTYTFLVSNGARAMDKVDGDWRAVFDSPEAAEAIVYIWQLINGTFERDGQTIRGATLINTGNGKIEWDRGNVAMQFSYLRSELTGQLNPQLIGIAPVPVSPRGTLGSEINCRMLGVFADSSPEQKLAIMDYIWYITSDEAQRIRTEVYIASGYGKFVNPQLLAKFGYDRLLRQVPEGWVKAFNTALENGVPEPYGRNTQFIYRDLSQPINTALEMPLGSLPHDEAVGRVLGLLQKTATEVNTKVLGNLSPEEMRFRRVIGLAVMLVVGATFSFGMYRIWQYFTLVSAPFTSEGGWRKYVWGYVLLAPALALVALWAYLPLAGGFALSFTEYELVIDSALIGVDNFANALFDERFWSGLGRTLYFVTLMIGLGFWPPILLAILLDEVPTATLKYLFRTIYYLPAVISGVIMIFLWRQLYDPSEYGPLNQLVLSVNHLGPVAATLLKWVVLGLWGSLIAILVWLPVKMEEMSWLIKATLWAVALAFVGVTLWPLFDAFRGLDPLMAQAMGVDPASTGGVGAAVGVLGHLFGRFELEPLRWIQSPEMAMLCVVIPTVWSASGPACILYLAALKTVPGEMYEAADIDGAGTWQKICYITLPRLKYLIVIQFIAAVIAAFKGGTDYILALTGGGPNDATYILALEIFTRTFLDLKFGLGAAMAWILGALLIAFTAYQLKMLSKAEFRSASQSEQ